LFVCSFVGHQGVVKAAGAYRVGHTDLFIVIIVLQESYVWSMYQQRIWDFFPVGECFRKQYEEELKL